LLLPAGNTAVSDADRDTVRRLCELAVPSPDPKADALERMLTECGGKTIVFVQPRATVRHLFRRLHRHRVAAVLGDRGWLGTESASRAADLPPFSLLDQHGTVPLDSPVTAIMYS